MDIKYVIEVFGYIGSVMVAVSMLMSSIVKLRIINTIGSVISGIYAVICGAIPLALMNICLIIINAVSLYKLLHNNRVYDLIIGNTEDSYITYFLEHYETDIKEFFPDFDKNSVSGKNAFMVCCEGTPAGILIGEAKEDTLDIDIDYSTPAYRDCSVGAYLYSNLLDKGFRRLVFAYKKTNTHVNYMKKMEFVKDNDYYEKILEEY